MKAAVVLIACVAMLSGCSDRPGPDVTGVLLITLDTTRADRLGCYGYADAATPNLDGLAGESTLFEEVQSPVPVTLPSHASMFTGNYPSVHGVRYNGMFTLGDASVTVAELLRDAGWETIGMPAAYPLTTKTGVGQGFDTYRDPFEEIEKKEGSETGERNAEEITTQGVEWLSQHEGEPFFLWMHYFDPHNPYKPPFPFSVRYRERPYDGEIAFLDQELGRLFDALKEHGLWDKILIIVAADHGEALYQHGEKYHSNLVYQSTLRVPMIIHGPGIEAGLRVAEPVSLVDIAPTILDYAGLPPSEMNGVTLRPALQGEDLHPRSLYFESLSGSLSYGWSPLEGVRRGPWKYIRSVRPELFNLEEDPDEEEDLHSIESSRAQDMEQDLIDLLERTGGSGSIDPGTQTPLDPEEAERLASLGYVGGAIVAENRDGTHPRDMVHLEITVMAARRLQRDKQYEKALQLWETILKQDPSNRSALHNGVIAAFKLGKMDQGIELGKRLTTDWPDFAPGFVAVGEGFAGAGRYLEAADVFEAGLAKSATDNGLIYRLVVALYSGGRTKEAAELARDLLEGGGEAYYRVILSACLARQGALQEAASELQTAISDGYARREVLETEPLLEPLRRLPEFKQLISVLPEPEDTAETSDAEE